MPVDTTEQSLAQLYPIVAPSPSVLTGEALPSTQDPSSVLGEMYPIRSANPHEQALMKLYKPTPDLYDQTIGAFEYGSADVASKLSKFVGLDSISQDLENFKTSHPEYAPEEVNSAWDLITNPRAIAGRVFGSAPQLLLTAGAYTAGGPLLAGALSYGIENQRAYDNAKMAGASDAEATTAGRVQGIINAAWNVLPVHKIFRFAQGAESAVQAKAFSTAMQTIQQTGAVGQTAKFIATQALFGVLQGSSNELLENQIYGKEIPKGFLDRQLQNAVGAGVAGAVFGLSARYLNSLKLEQEPFARTMTTKELQGILDPADMALPPEAGRAISAFVGHEPNSRDKTDFEAAGIMNDRFLEDAFSKSPTSDGLKVRQQLEDAFAPVRKSLRDVYGDSITLYRVQRPVPEGSGVRNVLSWTANKKFAEYYANAQPVKEITNEEIQNAVSEFDKKGTLTFRGKKYVTNPDGYGVDVYKLADAYGDEELSYTDESIAHDLKNRQETLQEYAQKARENAKLIVKENIPLNDVVWATDRAGQMEFIVKAGARTNEVSQLQDRFNNSVTRPGVPTVLDLVPLKEYPKQVDASSAGDLSVVNRVKDAARKFFSPILPMWAKMSEGPIRDNLRSVLDDAGSYEHSRLGQYSERLWNSLKTAQSDGSLDKLHEESSIPMADGGSANFELMYRMNDPRGVPEELRNPQDVPPPDSGGQQYLDLAEEARKREGAETVLAQGVRERGDWRKGKGSGSVQPFYVARDPHLPRFFTEEAWDLFQGRLSQDKRDYVENVIYKLNDKTFANVNELSALATRDFGENDPNRIIGLLEKGRDIPIMPSSVTFPDGSKIQLLNTNPEHMFKQSVSLTARKNAQTRMVGQGILESATDKQLKKATSLFGVEPTIDNGFLTGELLNKGVPKEMIDSFKLPKKPVLASPSGVEGVAGDVSSKFIQSQAKRSQGNLESGLQNVFDPLRARGTVPDVQSPEAGFVEQMAQSAESMKSERNRIKALAQSMDIPTKMTREYRLRALDNVDPYSLTDQQVKDMKGLAREVGGINLRLDTPELLDSLKQRLSQDVVRRGWEPYLEEYRASGGDPKDALNMIKLFNGIPLSRLGSSTGANVARLASSLIGAMQTSSSAIPNLFQPLLSASLVGERRLAQAMNRTMTDTSAVRSEQLSLGSILPTLFTASREGSSLITKLSDNIREGAASLSLTKAVNERNNLMTGDAAVRMANDWKENGIPKSEMWKVKVLGLQPDEVNDIAAGNMRDFTYRKIVQAAVAKSQYNMEFPWNKAPLENSPIGRMIFAYNSYMLGQTRTLLNLASHTWSVMSSPSKLASPEGLGLVKRIVTLGVTSVGAGMMSQILRQALKGDLSQQVNEDDFTKMVNGFAEVQYLGVAQRMSDAMTYDNGDLEKAFVGLMPQVSFATQFLGTLLGYGRYGKFSLDSRLWEATKKGTPVLRGIDSFINEIAYPDLGDYKLTKGASSKFDREVVRQGASTPGEDQLDPKYYRIFQDVARNDPESAMNNARSFYRDALANGDDMAKTVRQLRSSLMGRSPIPLNDIHTVQFLMSQPKDRRVEHVRNFLRYTQLVDQIAPSGI